MLVQQNMVCSVCVMPEPLPRHWVQRIGYNGIGYNVLGTTVLGTTFLGQYAKPTPALRRVLHTAD